MNDNEYSSIFIERLCKKNIRGMLLNVELNWELWFVYKSKFVPICDLYSFVIKIVYIEKISVFR